MKIVDAQVHIWGADTPARPWRPGTAVQAQKPYPISHDMLIAAMNEAGVERVVIVPPSWEGDRNDLALEAVRQYPTRFGIMGRLAVEKPESRALVAGWKKQPGMLGMRFTFHTDLQRPWLTDGTAEWLWAAAEREQIPLMIFVPGSVPAVDAIAAKYPGLKLVIDHLALHGTKKDAAAFEHLPEVLKLAKRHNVAVKASALPCYSTEPYPFPGLHRYIRQVYDAFGPKRMFWGTDWTRLTCGYRQAITLFTEELPWLSASDKEWIMGRGICEWLDWPLPNEGKAAGRTATQVKSRAAGKRPSTARKRSRPKGKRR